MSRRLMFAMVSLVFGALVLAGLASLLIASHRAVDQTRRELVSEAQSLAYTVNAQATDKTDRAAALRNLLVSLQPTLRTSGSTVLGVTAQGTLFNIPRSSSLTLPRGVSGGELDPSALARHQTVSGSRGRLAFAAVPQATELQVAGIPRQVDLVVVLTRQAPNTLTSAGPWFALSSLLILMVAALVSWRLGRRFVRPLAAAQDVTLRVAAGDLDARVPVPASAAGPELIALARSINDMADRLARAKGAERLFLQSVSHDLRTPLTSIRGFAEAIQDGAAPDVQGAAGVIASEARRLERLVADLLALATLEARRFTLQLQAVDLNSSARSTAAAFAPAAAELGLSLTVTGGGGGPVDAIADPDRLAQVTANLVENALRYSRHGVTVETVAGGGRARLCVEDDGPGITAADLPHVFDRLYESRPRPDRPIGSGLGLTIVSELVRAMGGSVWAESPTGAAGGTRMVVELATPPIHVPA